MSRFFGGPVHGAELSLRRAPAMLRVVVGPSAKVDALDQLEDVAAENEQIFVYHIKSRVSRMHVCRRGAGAAGSGWFESADYQFLYEQPAEADIRDNAAWARWCKQNYQHLTAVIKKNFTRRSA